MGRPKKQPFNMGFDEETRLKIEAIANEKGTSLAEAVRRVILAYKLGEV